MTAVLAANEVERGAATTSLDTPEHPAPRLPNPPDPIGAYFYRDAVAEALEELSATLDTSRVARAALKRALVLRECGRAGVLIACGACGTRHLVPYRCSARTCPVCSRRHAARIAERTARRVTVHDLTMEAEPWDGHTPYRQSRRWRHITLTTPADHDLEVRFEPVALARLIRAIREATSRFWRKTPYGTQKRDSATRRKRARRDTSYIAGIEVAPGGMVHVHMLVYGEYVPQALLQRLWGEALGQPAFVFVQAVKGSDGIDAAIRETLKYATKGERDVRTQARHAAAVEIAFWNVKRLSVGGALRRVRVDDQPAGGDDGLPEDVHSSHELACGACGAVGSWQWGGVVAPAAVLENGGYGVVGRGSGLPSGSQSGSPSGVLP